MGFSRQEYWSGLPCTSPGNLPDPGTEPTSLWSPVLAASSLPLVPPGKIAKWSLPKCYLAIPACHTIIIFFFCDEYLLFIRPPEFICLIFGSLYTLTNIIWSPLLPPLPLITTTLLCLCDFGSSFDSKCKVMLYNICIYLPDLFNSVYALWFHPGCCK